MSIFKRKVYFYCEYSDLEKLIKERLGLEYEIPYMEEVDNGSKIEAHTTYYDDHDRSDVEKSFKDGPNPYMLRSIIGYMADKGMIEHGIYLVNVSW